jgi:hypothetical protein
VTPEMIVVSSDVIEVSKPSVEVSWLGISDTAGTGVSEGMK